MYKNKKLLVVGSCSIHVFNFINLVKNLFDEILLLTDKKCNFNKYGFKIVNLDFSSKNLFTICRIKKIIKKFKPTHIHIHQANNYAFFTLLAAKKFNSMKVLNVWGSDILINPNKNLILKHMVKYNLKHVDFVIGDSNLVLKEAKKIYPFIKAFNINFGVDIFKCEEKKENIIYSNRLHKKLYNIDKIIISFSKFVKQYPNWKLVIAGKGEETNNLKELVRKLKISDKVEFIGFVDKETNHYYYCKSKIYVSIPESDSVSLSLVEAILYKCIIFVSDISANKEVVNNKLGFFERDFENIDFKKYEKLVNVNKEKELNLLKKLYSKEYNKERLKKLYGI